MSDLAGIFGFFTLVTALLWGYFELAWYAEFRQPQPMDLRVKIGYLTFACGVFWVVATFAGRS